MYNIVIQAVGFLAAGLTIFSFQCATNKKLVGLQLLSTILFSVQFFLLGAFTGSASFLVALIRNLVLYNRGKKWANPKVWLWIIIVTSISLSYLTYTSIFSIFPAIAIVSGTIALFGDNRGYIRLANLVIVCPAWLIYHIWAGAYAGIFNEVFIMASVLVSIKRYGLSNLLENES